MRRALVSLYVVSVLVCHVGSAWAQQLNPTGRDIDLPVGLVDQDRVIGQATLHITKTDELSVHGPGVRALLEGTLNEEALQRLAGFDGQDGALTIDAFEQAGVPISYDPGALMLKIDIPPEARPTSSIGLGRENVRSANIVDPAMMSGYVNIRGGAGFDDDARDDDTNYDLPVVDFDAAFRIGAPVLEFEGTLDSDVVANGDGVGAAFQRRGTRLVWDFPETIMRVTAGDVAGSAVGFQDGVDVLGIGFQREYGLLRPTELVRPQADRNFTLTRASSVDVVVNGTVVRSLNLQPGTYDLDDIPLADGANDITLIVRSDTGQEERIEFSQFFRADLLAAGVYEYGLFTGLDADTVDESTDYDIADMVVSGWIDYGLTDEFTIGLNAQGDNGNALVGGSLLTATLFGDVTLEGAGSWLEGQSGQNFTGGRFRAQLDKSLGFESGNFGSFGVFADYRTRNFTTLSDDEPNEDVSVEFGARYSVSPWEDLSFSVSGSQRYGQRDGDDELDLFAGLSGTGPYEVSWSIGGDYQRTSGEDDEFGLFFSLSRAFGDFNTSARYVSDDNAADVNVNYSQGSGVGAWSAGLGVGRSDDQAGEISGRASYTGNRYEANASASNEFSDIDTDTRSTSVRFQLGTALVFAGDSMAMGRPVSNSFAIVAADESLEGRRVLLNPDNEGNYEAASDMMGPAVISGLPAYSPATVGYTVEDLPPGADIGDGLFEMEPPYRGGYALTVALEAEVTAMGVLKDDLGRPVSLVSGKAVNLDDAEMMPLITFTDRNGRFALIGAKPGRYKLQLNSDPPQIAEISIAEEASGVVRLGEIETKVAR